MLGRVFVDQYRTMESDARTPAKPESDVHAKLVGHVGT